jgi:hypothetical protein
MTDYEKALKAVTECIDVLYSLPESKKITAMIRKMYVVKAELTATVEKAKVLECIKPKVFPNAKVFPNE